MTNVKTTAIYSDWDIRKIEGFLPKEDELEKILAEDAQSRKLWLAALDALNRLLLWRKMTSAEVTFLMTAAGQKGDRE